MKCRHWFSLSALIVAGLLLSGSAVAASFEEITKEIERVTQEMEACGYDSNCINAVSQKLNALIQKLQQATPPMTLPPQSQSEPGAGSTSVSPSDTQPPTTGSQTIPTRSAGTPGKQVPPSVSSNAETQTRFEEMRAELKRKAEPPPPTTVELIDRAEEEINPGTALLFKAYAVFGDKRLPGAYRSERPVSEGTKIMRDIRRNFRSLSPRARQALVPYLVNPLHPDSIFNQGTKYGAFRLPSLFREAHADTLIPVITDSGKLKEMKRQGGWVSLTAANRKIKFWYKRGSGDKRIAEESKKYFDEGRIREKLVGLMGVAPPQDKSLAGDDRLYDIWFYPLADYSVTYPLEDTEQSATTIIIRRSLLGKRLAGTLAHEFFHAIQYNFNAYAYADSDLTGLTDNARKARIKKRRELEEFLSESTATWAEDFVFKGKNTEQEYLPTFFQKPEDPLYDIKDTHEYSAYLFHFYFEQKYGPSFMRDIWKKRKQGKPQLQALMEAAGPDFRERFKEFALWNWNRDPVLLYKDKGKFPKKGMKHETYPLEMLNPLSEISSLKPLTAHYLHMTEKDKAIRKARFELKDFNALKNSGVWAILKIRNRTAYIEDWSHDDEKVFCFDNPDEDLERITLIHVNTDEKDDLTPISRVTRSRNPCSPKLEITLTIRGEESESHRLVSGTTVSDGSSISGRSHLSVVFKEKPVYPHLQLPQAPTVLIPTGNLSYDLNVRQWGKECCNSWNTEKSIHAQATWTGNKEMMSLYENPTVTMNALPVEGSDTTEYSIYLDVEGHYTGHYTYNSPTGKYVDGVTTADPIHKTESDSGTHPVMMEIKVVAPRGTSAIEITPEHVVDRQHVFPVSNASIISYPEARLTVRGRLEFFEDF